MYTPIIIITTLVSLDALFVGMSLKLQKEFKKAYLFIIFAIILTICVIAYFLAGVLMAHIDFDTSWIIGGAFILLGIRNLFAEDEEKMVLTIGAVIVLGFIMSIDAAVATVALTIGQGKTFLTPVLASGGHLMFLLAGCVIASFIKTSHRTHNIISSFCLFLVAMLNFIGLL